MQARFAVIMLTSVLCAAALIAVVVLVAARA
jgi:hypothetical protein